VAVQRRIRQPTTAMGVKRVHEEISAALAPAPAHDIDAALDEIWDGVKEQPAAALCLMSTEFEEDGVAADYFDKVRKYVDTLEPSSPEATLFHAVKDMPDEVVMVEIGEHAVAGEMDEEEVAELAAMTPAERKRELFVLKLEAHEAELQGEEGEEGEFDDDDDDIRSIDGASDDDDDEDESEEEGEEAGEGAAQRTES